MLEPPHVWNIEKRVRRVSSFWLVVVNVIVVELPMNDRAMDGFTTVHGPFLCMKKDQGARDGIHTQ